jgi:hypothetical protein
MEAAAIAWEQGLLEDKRDYVERQLSAGVSVATVVSDLVRMGAEADAAVLFVARVSKGAKAGSGVTAVPVSALGYVAWGALAAIAGIVAGGLLVLGAGLTLTEADLVAATPSLAVVARVEGAILVPGVVVGVLLRRRIAPGAVMRPVTAAVGALAGVLAVRYLTVVEAAREAAGLAGKPAGFLATLTDGGVAGGFARHPGNVYALWGSAQLGSLILWDVGFAALVGFVAVVFSRSAD